MGNNNRKYLTKTTNPQGVETFQEHKTPEEAEAFIEFFNRANIELEKQGLPTGKCELVGLTEDIDPKTLSPREREQINREQIALKNALQSHFEKIGFKVVNESEFTITNKSIMEIPANSGRECCVKNCSYAQSGLIGVKIPIAGRIIYFCARHFRKLEDINNYEDFWSHNKAREDKGEGVYFDPIDFWEK